MEQKYCIKHRLSNGTYLAILNGGWRYDGSMIIEAGNKAELEEKLNEARYDDRWVTMNGNHVLIGGNGYIKAGAGGRLTGRKFGMRFRDYEHGRVSKNGKRMIRQYSVVAKKNGEKHVKGGKDRIAHKHLKKLESELNLALEKSKVAMDAYLVAHKELKKHSVGSAKYLKFYKEWDTAKNEFDIWNNKVLVARQKVTDYRDKAAAKGVKFISNHYNDLKNVFQRAEISKIPVSKLKASLSEAEIITKVGGPDKTKGSCVSVALAYIANKQGLDTLDYRGGKSQDAFSLRTNIKRISHLDNIKGESRQVFKQLRETKAFLEIAEKNKEYLLVAGKHAVIIKRGDDGFKYLELQGEEYQNGWNNLDDKALKKRFGVLVGAKTVNRTKVETDVFMMDVDSFGKSSEFASFVPYFNTKANKQKKGVGGYAK